jgi:hypothetical protein
MSIYVMTLGELAKRRGEPVGEFVKKVQAAGFDAGSHAKRLTQEDLNTIVSLIDGNVTIEKANSKVREEVKVNNPNVLMLKTSNGSTLIAFVDASLNEDGTIGVEIVESNIESGIGDSLLEFRRQLGTKLGVN